MKRPNITPGPWEVTDNYTALFHNDLREEVVYEVNGREAGNSPAYATSEEHALAIAAVPALLSALEKLLATAEKQLDQSATHDGLTNCKTLADARTALIEAGYTFD